jgi:N4-gp56 family major capsid protein
MDTRNRKAIVLPISRDIEGGITRLPATHVVIKVKVRTLQAQDKPLNQMTHILGIQLRETEDALTRDMMAGTAAFVNCVGGVNGDLPTELTVSDCDGVVSALMGANARKLLSNIQGEDRFGTAPIKNSYMALAHTDLSGDLMAAPGFKHSSAYPDQRNIAAAEWGQLSSLRFFLSSVGSYVDGASNLGNTVYNVFCVGLEAIGIVDQDGFNAQLIYTPPSIAGGPLWQNASLAWKTSFVARVLNDSWIVRLRCTLRP